MPIYKTKEKRDGLFKYRVIVNYTDHNGDYKTMERSIYGSTEAKELESKLIAECKSAPPASRLTLSELKTEYLKSLKNDVRATSYKKTEDVLNKILTEPYAKIRVDKLRACSHRRFNKVWI